MSKDKSPHYRQPFYRRQALRFECTACGACCSGGNDYHVFLTADEARAIRAHLGLSWSWFRRRYLLLLPEDGLVLQSDENDDCIFLDDEGRCRIYPVRPAQCSSYPFWPEVLASSKGWRREARRCEGIDRGAVVPLATIEEILERGE